MNRMETHMIILGAYSWSVLLRNSLYDAESYHTTPALPSIMAVRETLFDGLPWSDSFFAVWNEFKEDLA